MNAWNSSWTGICCRDEHGFPNSERSEKRYRSGQRNFEGNLLFSPVTTSPPGEAKGIGLAPVAVRPDVQSQGIGSKLIREGLRLCQELGDDYCVVPGAPKYYQRYGFERASNFGLQNEYRVDNEFMVIRFTKPGLSEERLADKLVICAPDFGLFPI